MMDEVICAVFGVVAVAAVFGGTFLLGTIWMGRHVQRVGTQKKKEK